MPDWVQAVDESALWWIAEHLRTPLCTAALSVYTALGDKGLLFIALAALLLLFRSTRKGGAAALVAMLLGLLVTNLTLKPLVARSRPWVVMAGFVHLVEESDPNSFPSGHSCSAFAFAVALCAALPRRGRGMVGIKCAALAAAVLMAFSRLYVGVHFPSDVLAGALVGALCGLAGAWIVNWLTRRFPRLRQSLPGG